MQTFIKLGLIKQLTAIKETHNRQSFLHRDGDIWTAIKCIIYLCDVNEDNGPFCYQNNKGKLYPFMDRQGTMLYFSKMYFYVIRDLTR